MERENEFPLSRFHFSVLFFWCPAWVWMQGEDQRGPPREGLSSMKRRRDQGAEEEEKEEKERWHHHQHQHQPDVPGGQPRGKAVAAVAGERAQELVRSHYNARPNTSVEDRVRSPIYHLRNLNNWIKSALIGEYTPKENAVVLDLCAGKGGDLPKWCKARINYWVAAGAHAMPPTEADKKAELLAVSWRV